MLYLPNVLKRCPQCENIYPATPEYFHRNRTTADGFQRQCAICHRKAVHQKKKEPFEQLLLWENSTTNENNLDIETPEKTKQCTKCKQWKLATAKYFHRDRAMADGLTYACSECRTKARNEWLAAHPEQANKKKVKSTRKYEPIPDGFKRCTKCQETLPATTEYFHSDKSHASGLRTQCRTCRNEIVQKQRAETPEQQRVIRQRFYRNHTERVKKKVREYVDRNREKRSEYEREYWQKNVDKRQAKHVRRKAAKKSLPNTFTAQDWEHCLDYWGNRCAACGREADNETIVLSPDHWIALTDPRADNPGTVPMNIVPLCGALKGGRNACNNTKHKRNAMTWLIERFGEGEAQVILARVQAYFDSLHD
jgi:hypothetical protein